jgi:hypothetical protein
VTRSLLPDRYNRVDDAFLSAISRTFHRQTKAQPASPEAAPTPVEDSSDQLVRAATVERFMLALSDQQLVTGIAILVAVYVKNCSISVYSFQIAASLAWFSCTTHLSTLTVLRNYFDTHQKVRTWRVVAMLALLFLLVFSMVLSHSATFYTNSGAYFECAIKTFRLFEGLGLIGWFGSYSEVLNLILIVGWIAVAYFSRLVELYSLAYRNSSEYWLAWLISRGVLGPKEWAPRGSFIREILADARVG